MQPVEKKKLEFYWFSAEYLWYQREKIHILKESDARKFNVSKTNHGNVWAKQIFAETILCK